LSDKAVAGQPRGGGYALKASKREASPEKRQPFQFHWTKALIKDEFDGAGV
jgi:hypothetical protein